MSQNEKGLNILICGSQKFSDESFVFGMMDQIFKAYDGKIETVFTSKFSGSCEFVRNWIATTNESIQEFNNYKLEEWKNTYGSVKGFIPQKQINASDCTFDMHLAKENISLYEELDIPDFIIQNDPFFQKGKELLMSNSIQMILAFPNPEGVLGASTQNIHRFAKLAQIDNCFFDCSKAYKEINALKQEKLIQLQQENHTGFNNRHPGKKF